MKTKVGVLAAVLIGLAGCTGGQGPPGPLPIFVAGDDGTILTSDDNGTTWLTRFSGLSDDLAGIARGSRTVARAVGDNDTILKTTDGGQLWGQFQPGYPHADLRAIAALNADDAYAVGENGEIDWSACGGLWAYNRTTASEDLNAVSTFGSAVAWVAGNDGSVRKTAGCGSTWQTLNLGTSKNLHGVAAISAAEAWIVGDDGTILRSTDGGFSWMRQASGTTKHLRAVN